MTTEPEESFADRITRFSDQIAAALGISDRKGFVLREIPPSQPMHLRATHVTSTTISLAWNEPVRGTHPIAFTAFIRLHGTRAWCLGGTSKITSVTIRNLKPKTRYDIEILAHNW